MTDNNENTGDIKRISEHIGKFRATNEGLIPPKPIEMYVRRKARTFESEPGSRKQAAQVEDLVEEILDELDPDIPEESMMISNWIRRTVDDETGGDVEGSDD